MQWGRWAMAVVALVVLGRAAGSAQGQRVSADAELNLWHYQT
jgi:hypothetical protein